MSTVLSPFCRPGQTLVEVCLFRAPWMLGVVVNNRAERRCGWSPGFAVVTMVRIIFPGGGRTNCEFSSWTLCLADSDCYIYVVLLNSWTELHTQRPLWQDLPTIPKEACQKALWCHSAHETCRNEWLYFFPSLIASFATAETSRISTRLPGGISPYWLLPSAHKW